jgi:ferrous iron transport protein B
VNRHQPQGARPLRIALLGNPNCGKTALFNLLTGSRQKVANYAGVTVERKAGHFRTPGGRPVEVLDLPGAYSLHAISADEAVTRDIVTGREPGEARPDLLVCVVDATNLRLNLRLVLEARPLGLPMVLALNMSDQAAREGLVIDREALSRELGMPVVETVGVRQHGADALLAWLDGFDASTPVAATVPPVAPLGSEDDELARVTATQQEVLPPRGSEPTGS